MAEAVLQNVVLLKQANVLSRQLGEHSVYQFTVVASDAERESKYTPHSRIAGLDGLEEMDDPALASADKPCVGVKVLDYAATRIRTWSLTKLQDRVNKMRSLVNVRANPGVRRYFALGAEEDEGAYTYVGRALVSALTVLKRVKLATFDRVPVWSPYEEQVSGYLRAQVRFISLTPPDGTASPGRTSRASTIETAHDDDLPLGYKLNLSLSIDELTGFNTDHYASVHLQVRQSSLAPDAGNAPSESNGAAQGTSGDGRLRLQRAPQVWISGANVALGITASVPVELTSRAMWKEVRLRKTFSLTITPAVQRQLREGLIEIEVHARISPDYLEQVEAYDLSRTSLSKPLTIPSATPLGENKVLAPTSSLPDGGLLPPQPDGFAFDQRPAALPGTDTDPASAARQPETEMRLEERHNVLASVQVCEVGDKDYEPVPVIAAGLAFTHTGPSCFSSSTPGLTAAGAVPARTLVPSLDGHAFLLRQGFQRKVCLRLRSESGRQLGWQRLRSLELGLVRQADSVRVASSSELGADMASFPSSFSAQDDPPSLEAPRSQTFVTLSVPAAQQSLTFRDDGTSELTAWAWWDSSVHESTLLTAVSPSDARVVVRARAWIDVPDCQPFEAASYVPPFAPVSQQEGMVLEMDWPMVVQRRDAKPALSGLFSKLSSKLTGSTLASLAPTTPTERRSDFLLCLLARPALTTNRQELWRVDTANTYVRGQEGITGVWRPRRLSLLREFYDSRALAERKAQIAGVREWLKSDSVVEALAATPQAPATTDEAQGDSDTALTMAATQEEAKLEIQSDVVTYWSSLVARRRAKVAFTHEATAVRSAAAAARRAMAQSASTSVTSEADELPDASSRAWNRATPATGRSKALGDRLAAVASGDDADRSDRPVNQVQVTMVGGGDIPSAPLGKKVISPSATGYWSGPLNVLSTADDSVSPRWGVLRRPFLMLHVLAPDGQSAGLLEVVLGLSSVRVEHDAHTEQLLGKENVLTLYTPANSWLLQAPSRTALEGWMSALDSFASSAP